MEELFNGIAATLVTAMTFYSQRMIKSIDDRFEKLEAKIKNMERLYQAETDRQESKIEQLKSYNESIMYRLTKDTIKHANLITEKIDKVYSEQENQKKNHSEIYGKIIHLKASDTNNKSAIAIQQKKLDILYQKIKPVK